MKKWKTVRIQQELLEEVKEEVKKSKYKNLSEFVSDAIQLRIQQLAKERIPKYLERDRYSRTLLKAPLYYTAKHIWAQVTPQGTVRIGITDYFQSQVKNVLYVVTDKSGEKVSKEVPFGMIESWWFAYDLCSPLDGKIVAVNEKVMREPFTLNAEPDQWIIEVEPTPLELNSWMDGLLSSEKYQKQIIERERWL